MTARKADRSLSLETCVPDDGHIVVSERGEQRGLLGFEAALILEKGARKSNSRRWWTKLCSKLGSGARDHDGTFNGRAR